MVDISQVDYSAYDGDGTIISWINSACIAAGIEANNDWRNGLKQLCQRESSLDPNAVNSTDANANGPLVSDGYPQNCSRGIAQCIPSTFVEYHADGTSWKIYDPVANIAASINYVLSRYRVSRDGSDLSSKVQQADTRRPPKGYIMVS